MAGPALAIAGFLCVLAAVAYWLLRHVYLAALTVAAPVCVLVSVLFLPNAWRSQSLVIGMFVAPICAMLIFDRASRSICAGAVSRAAFASARREALAAIAPVLVAYIVALFALLPGWVVWARDALDVAAGFAIALALGAAATSFSYSEAFIARANAARERRERLFESPAGLSETRWSLSVSGIALALAAVAVFGIRGFDVAIDWRLSAEFAGSAVLLAAAFAAITRNWRLTLAATLAALLAALLAFWMLAQVLPESMTTLVLWFGLFLELVAMSVFVLRLSRYVNRDETPSAAIAMTLREQGPATVAASLVLAAAAVINVLLFDQASIASFMPIIAGLAAALLFFPAFGNVLYWLLPRYRSVDEVFKR
jgi:hypothetical protein